MTRNCTITVPYLGYKLTFDVLYHWEGQRLEIDDAQLVEWDGDVATQQQILLHGNAALIDPAELIAAIVEADAEKYVACNQGTDQ